MKPSFSSPSQESQAIFHLTPAGFWAQLTQPHPSIQEPERRRRVRLLSALLMEFVLVGIGAIILNRLVGGPVFNVPLALVDVIVLAIAYGLSRTKHYLIAAALTGITIWVTVLFGSIVDRDPDSLYFLIAGVLFCSLYFSPRATITASAATIALMLLLPMVSPVFSFSMIMSVAFVVGLTGTLGIVVATVQRQDFIHIEQQSRKLSAQVIELVRGREALQQSQSRLASILGNASEAIIAIDESQHIILFNKGAEQIFGYQAGEILGQPLDALIPHEYIEAYRQQFKAFKGTFPTSGSLGMRREFSGRRKDGSEFPAQIGISSHVENGHVIFIAVIVDITERKSAEEKLQKSEALLQLQIARMPIACIVWDTDFHITSWNPAAEKIFGFSAKEAIGRHPYGLIVPVKARAQTDVIWARLMEGDTTAHSVNENLTKDGRTIICEWSNTPLKVANGKIVGVLSMAQDITERGRVEEALSANEARYRSLFNQIPVALYRTSSQGQILDANPALVELLGYPDRETLLGVNVTEIFVEPEDRVKERSVLDQESIVRGIRLQLRRYDGSLIWVRDIARIVTDAEGSVLYYEGSLEDISEQVQAEEQIRKNTAQNQALAEISQSIDGVGLDTQAVLDIVSRRVAELVGDASVITLLSDDGQQLQLVSIYPPHSKALDPVREVTACSPIRLGEGLFGRVAQTGQPVVVEDVTREEIRAAIPPAYRQTLERHGVHSLMIVPLRAQNRVTGTLGVSRIRSEPPYGDEDLVYLQEIADRTALAIANAQLYDKAHRSLSKVQALRRIDLAITSNVDLQVSLGTILDQVMSQTGVDAANVLILNPHTLTLEYMGGRGFRTNTLQYTHLRLGEGYAGRAALEQRTLYVLDLRSRYTDFLRSPSFTAEAFVSYYAVPLIVKGLVKGVLEIFHRSLLDPDAEWIEFLEALAGQAAIAIENASLFEDLQHTNQKLILAYDATIEGWSHALDLRDKETEGHTKRVTEITLRLARAMGVSEIDLVHIRRGALLHDIGKMGIPDQILLKPGPLTEEEWEVMHRHPVYANEMLAPIAYLKPALDIPYCHHEKWDGTGYPRGLKGEQIPMAARAFAVVDVWDALRSDRPYRPAWPDEKVRQYIQEQTGMHFDPYVVNIFLKVIDQGKSTP